MGAITKVTATSSNSTVLTTSVNEYNIVAFSTKKKGEARLIITAEDEVNGYSASGELIFNVVEAEDVVDVVTGTIKARESYEDGSTLSAVNDYLESISFKIKDSYKDILHLHFSGGIVSENPVEVTEQNGVFTVTNTRVPCSAIPQGYFQIMALDDHCQIGGAQATFYPDEEEAYPLQSATMKVGYGAYAKGDGETLTVPISQGNTQANFEICPRLIIDKSYVVAEVSSSDDSVLLVDASGRTTWGSEIRIPVQLVSEGTAVLTLHITDGMEYDETATVTIVVTE